MCNGASYFLALIKY